MDDDTLRLLIVDDDALDRMAVRRALQKTDLSVQIDEADTCAGAVARLARRDLDCALLDFQLPDGDARDVLRGAREAGSDTPIVMLTGHGDEMIAVELMKAGAADYLPKARLSPEGLARCLTGVVRLSRAQRQARRAEDAQRFLTEASAVLSASLDFQTTLANVARLAVPQLADFCIVDLLDEAGVIQRVEVAHADPAHAQRARDMGRRYPTGAEVMIGTPRVLRTGRPELVTEFGEALLAALSQDGVHLRALRESNIHSYLCVPLMVRGRALGALTFLATGARRPYDEADLSLAEQAAQRAALAVDNARLFFETQARAEREAAVNAIGRALRESLDADEIIHVATGEVGRALKVGRCLWAWVSPAKDGIEIAPQQYAASGGLLRAGRLRFGDIAPDALACWTAGEPLLASDIATDPRAPFSRRPEMSTVDAQALIACPAFLRGEWMGLFVVYQTDGPRSWTPDEVSLLTQAADLLAPALDNARRYAREHQVADRLQAAFLSNVPDTLGTLDLSALYRAGLAESQVGGDFYDAFPLPDGRVALVMADVSGKGLDAAVLTATAKFSLRAFASEVAAPGLVLTRLNRLLCGEASDMGEHFVTLFYGVFSPATGRLTYASAGHETQLLKRRTGGTVPLISTGPILGIAEHRYSQRVEQLEPGDSLVLFTDGLTEARSSVNRDLLDLSRVTALLERMGPEVGAGALASRLQQLALEWTADRPHDDLALLVARRSEEAVVFGDGAADVNALVVEEDARPEEFIEPGELLFQFSFPSRPTHTPEVRQAVGHWMAALGFTRRETEDFQTAVTEAVANAIRHGSPSGASDQYRVTGSRLSSGTLAVDVSDSGPGLPDLAEIPPMPGPDADRGRGLPLMRALSDSVESLPADGGLCLRLTKKRQPPNPK